PLQFGTGAAKTHEVWLVLEPTDAAMAPADLAAAPTAPLGGSPPAAWIVSTRAGPHAPDPEGPRAPGLPPPPPAAAEPPRRPLPHRGPPRGVGGRPAGTVQ